MLEDEVTIDCTVSSDGTLDLDRKVQLPPGRVVARIRRAEYEKANGDWWQFMQSARQQLQNAGCQFLDDQGIQEQIAELQEEDRIDDLLRGMGSK